MLLWILATLATASPVDLLPATLDGHPRAEVQSTPANVTVDFRGQDLRVSVVLGPAPAADPVGQLRQASQYSGPFVVDGLDAGWGAVATPTSRAFTSTATVVAGATEVRVTVDPSVDPARASVLLHSLPVRALAVAFEEGLGQGRVELGDLIVLGALDRDAVDAAIRASGPDACVPGDSPAEGKVVVKVRIAADGAVEDATVRSTTLGSPEIGDCLAQRVRTASFGPAAGPGMVTCPFTVSPPG